MSHECTLKSRHQTGHVSWKPARLGSEMFQRTASVVLCAAYTLILLALCYCLPFSQLYRSVHSYKDLVQQVETQKDIRSAKAKDYFSSLNPHETFVPSPEFRRLLYAGHAVPHRCGLQPFPLHDLACCFLSNRSRHF
ncbi:unnamed protein product [Candidula unifasciata]|uniref:Uncharacterized protein n=1 Tax=Candidula unifasciata TaxID=100452 RepID=A0A8S3YVV9_9EUPU|nr:unnamed protein product [Candidula unifasciata]